MKHFQVDAVRDGGWWALTVPGVRAAHTQARRLDQAEAAVRDLLALLLDVEPDAFDVGITPRLTEHEVEALREIDQARARAEAARSEVARRQQRAARMLVHDKGLTVRDAGTIMGLSHQRVAQLVQAGERAGVGVRGA